MDRSTLLKYLPPADGNELVIEQDQSVPDIINEVLSAHYEFARDYDHIAHFFESNDIRQTAKRLFNFCKRNIEYDIEPKDDQTTRTPTVTLMLGHGDCKHYAGFIGGVLGAMQRLGYDIDWNYRFASYDLLEPTPGHVFVVVNDEGQEIWIDPVLSSFDERLQPQYIEDKTVKMLTRLSGVQNYSSPMDLVNIGPYNLRNIGLVITPYTGNTINYDGTDQFAGIFGPFLGISAYEEYDSASGTDWNQLASQLNAMIAKGPHPGHQVAGDFVRWIYENNIRTWNFYWPSGVMPGFNGEPYMPDDWPILVFQPDGRLTYDRMIAIPEKNPYIHILTAWAQALINEYSALPHPMKPSSMKEFSQGKYGGTDKMNMLYEYRGGSILDQLGDFVGDVLKRVNETFNVLKEGALTWFASGPRNAFLAIVGINLFGWATKLKNKISTTGFDKLAGVWKSVGGNPDKLRNTIEDGAQKPAVLGQARVGTTGVEWLAAAAPIIVLMLKFLDDDGKATEIVRAALPSIELATGVDLTPIQQGLPPINLSTGQPVKIYIPPEHDENLGGGTNELPTSALNIGTWIKDNPILSAGIALGLWELLAPKKYRLINK